MSLATNALTRRSAKQSDFPIRSYCNKPPSMNQVYKPEPKSKGGSKVLLSLFGLTTAAVTGGTAFCLYDGPTRTLVQSSVPYSSCYLAVVEGGLAQLGIVSLPPSNSTSSDKESSPRMDEEPSKTPDFVTPAIVAIPSPPITASTTETTSGERLQDKKEAEDKALTEAVIYVLDDANDSIKVTIDELNSGLDHMPTVDNIKSENLDQAVEHLNILFELYSSVKSQIENQYNSIEKASNALDSETLFKYVSNLTENSEYIDALQKKVGEAADLKRRIENKEFLFKETAIAEPTSDDLPADDLSTLTLNPPLSPPDQSGEDAPLSPSEVSAMSHVDDMPSELDIVIANAEMERQRYEEESEQRLESQRQQLHREYAEKLSHKEDEFNHRMTKKLHDTMALMTSAHTDCMELRLKRKDDEFSSVLADIVKVEREQERLVMRSELALWISKMHGIHEGLESRADSEHKGRKSRELWLACQSLLHSIDQEIGTPKPLEADVKAVLTAGNGHPLVAEVASQFTEESLARGVSSSSELKQRFSKVYKLSRRVAFIDPAHCSLFRHGLSIVQSSLVLRQPVAADGNCGPSLDTFQLVDSAECAMKRDDLLQALKFMNQLKGTPRKIANDWIEDTRRHLETKSAVEALVSHASASGLSALF